MKKVSAAKTFRRCAAALMAFAALTAMNASIAGAASPYVNKVAQVNEYNSNGTPSGASGISGVSQTQADNLMIYLMNRMYPVGSIYMWVPAPGATPLDGEAAVQAHFGGTWKAFAQGRILVGASSAAGYQIGTLTPLAPTTGGGMGSSGTLVPITANIPLNMNNITISSVQSSMSLGSITSSAPSLSISGSYTATHTATVTAANFVSHNHAGSVTWTSGNDYTLSNGDPQTYGNKDNMAGSSLSGNSSGSSAGGSSSVTMTGTTTFNLSSGTLNFSSFPTLRYNPAPTFVHIPQSLTKKELTLKADGNVYPDDTTVQPYQTCYIFVRTGLATYN